MAYISSGLSLSEEPFLPEISTVVLPAFWALMTAAWAARVGTRLNLRPWKMT